MVATKCTRGIPGKTSKMTAAQAIGWECNSCCPGQRMTPSRCPTTVCKLSPDVFRCRSSVKRIKAHCLDCAARDLEGTAHEAVRQCTGQLLQENGNGGMCWLHPFRLGKNPDRPKRGAVHPNSIAALRSRGREPSQERRSPPGQGSSPRVGVLTRNSAGSDGR